MRPAWRSRAASSARLAPWPAPSTQSIRLTLRAADFEGVKGLTPTDLTPAFAQYLGHDEPIAIVCEIRDRAATILREAGYIAAVQVPEQRIDNGLVHSRGC